MPLSILYNVNAITLSVLPQKAECIATIYNIDNGICLLLLIIRKVVHDVNRIVALHSALVALNLQQ